jgi:hypothetical protein
MLYTNTIQYIFSISILKKLKQAIHVLAWTSSEGSKEAEAPRFQDDRHIKVVKVISPTHRPP